MSNLQTANMSGTKLELFIINIKIMFPKLKIKVYFYHLFMLSIVMLLCFYLVYRDMKRIETNMLGIFNRITGMVVYNQIGSRQ